MMTDFLRRSSILAGACLSVLVWVCFASGCEEGVLPKELKELGSLRSATYVARHLYPQLDVELRVMRPRLGTPALVEPDQRTLDVTFYAGQAVDASGIRFVAHDEDSGGTSHECSAVGAPVCDEDGICDVRVEIPAGLPFGRLITFCAVG
jgi:hypothetical protein